MKKPEFNIAIADDHVLLRKGLVGLVKNIGYGVLFEADNGRDLIAKLLTEGIPDLVLMDINMPVMDGYETTAWLANHHPGIKVLALTMYDDESAVIKMLKSGARGYVLKGSDLSELRAAIRAVLTHGFYYSEMVSGKLVHSLTGNEEQDRQLHHLTEKEIDFLKLVCTDLTYKEIAQKMKVSPRTVDSYRDHLFEKLELKNRTGLVIYSIKNGIVKI